MPRRSRPARRPTADTRPRGGRRLVLERDGRLLRASMTLEPAVESLLLRFRGTDREIELAPESRDAGTAEFAIALDELVQHDPSCEWIDLWLRLEGTAEPKRAGRFDEVDRTGAVEALDVDGLAVTAHMTHKGNVSVRVQPERSYEVSVWTRDLRLVDGRVAFDVEVVTHNTRATRTTLRATSRETGASVEVPVDPEFLDLHSRRRNGLLRTRVTGDFSVADLPRDAFSSEIFDLSLVLELTGFEDSIERGIRIPPFNVRRRLTATSTTTGDAALLATPYFTFKAKRLCLRIETYARGDLVYMRRLLAVSWLFGLVRPFTRIWLVGELPYKAQDTGYHFFRWVRTHHPRRRAYYVIEGDSPERANVEPYGNVVVARSRRHILYSLLASRLISSHHAEYLLASRTPRFVRRSSGLRVFLQHGVMGTKNMVANYGRRASTDFRTDLFLVSSEREREMVVDDFEFLPSQVRVTGLSRFDALLADDVPVGRSILVIPTWRDWLRPATFAESDYFREWHGLLSSPRFRQIVARHQMDVTFILHPNMRSYASHFDVPGVTVLQQGDASVQDLMKKSAVMVTDYSSVGFDFSFLDRPVVYYQFDRGSFLGTRGSHLDLDADLPGDIGFTRDEVLDHLDAALDRGATITDANAARARAFLAHRDQDNNARIYDVVRRAWSPRVPVIRARSSAASRALWTRFRAGSRYYPTMRALYRLATWLPRRRMIVFESANGKQYGDSPRALYERLLERGTDHRLVWVNDTTVRLPDPGTSKIRRLSPRYFWALGRASHWISNQNFPHYLRPARGTRYVQTWHGTPLKKMQHDLEQVHGRPDGYLERVTKMTGYWDDLVSPSPYATEAFRSAFRYEGRVLETGYPRNDLFHRSGSGQQASLVKRRLGIDPRKRVVLYAPTFRDDATAGAGFTPQTALDLRLLHQHLGDDVIVLLRMHSVVRGRATVPDELSDFALDVSRYPDTQELLLATDVLITDYSSVLFDFAILDRPMVFFTYDLAHYRDDLRGFYLDFEREAPGPLASTTTEVAHAVVAALEGKDGYEDVRARFRERFAPYDDGLASDRVLDAVLGEPGERR